MNKRKEKKIKTPHFHFAKIISKRESAVFISILTIAFGILFIVFGILYFTMLSSERLTLENAVERTFNSIVWDMENGNQPDARFLSEYKIISIGVYSSVGELQYSWGQAYNRISVSSLVNQILTSGSSSMVVYDKNTGILEYARLLQNRVSFSSSNILSIDPQVGVNSSGVQFPSILYLAIDSTAYIKRNNGIKFGFFAFYLVFTLVYIFVLRLYLDNKSYRTKMIKNEALINIGSAARTLTHGIKNPLSAITIQLALMKRELKDEQLEELMVIDHEVKRLISLTNRVSDFLKNPTGNPEPIDIVDLLNTLFPLFSYEVKMISTSQHQAIVMFDPDRARSVFENLLKNAMESCEGRDPKVEVEITLDKHNNFHFFTRDRGDGIKPADMKNLFDPFYTTKIHGSGIGLAISRQFLTAQKGDIKIYPRDGGGTIVEVILPRYSILSELVGISHSARR